MLFFIIFLIAIISLAIYVVKKTKTKPTSFLAQGEYLVPDPIPHPTVADEFIPEGIVESPVVEAPKMVAKPKKKPQPKKKPTKEVNA
jgi:hypothetical protein